MVEVSLTVGKLDASLALLLTKDHHLIEFPTTLLPNGVKAGSIVKIRCDRDFELEQKETDLFNNIQEEILSTFGTNSPQAPILKIRNVTQTSCVLEWEPLELGTSSIKSLTLYKDGSRLGQIPNPLVNTTTKLSGLPIEKSFQFHLRLDTTAGIFESEKLKVTTHKMTDLSGITVCLGDLEINDRFDRSDIEQCLIKIGAKPLQDQVKVDTTHFVTTSKTGEQVKKALDNNIPVVRPEWLKACELERRIVGVRQFYLDADPEFLTRSDYWKKDESAKKQPPVPPKETEVVPEIKEQPKTEDVSVAESIEPIPESKKVDDGFDDVDINGVSKTEQEEAPVEEAPVEEAPVEEAPVEEAPVEEAPVEEAPVEEAPVEEAPVEEAPVEEAPVEEAPVEEETIEPETETEIAPAKEEVEQVEPEIESNPLADETPIDESTPISEVEEVANEETEEIPEVAKPAVVEDSVEEAPIEESAAEKETSETENVEEEGDEGVEEDDKEDSTTETQDSPNSNKPKNKKKKNKKKGKK